jgi:hypothetical protein
MWESDAASPCRATGARRGHPDPGRRPTGWSTAERDGRPHPPSLPCPNTSLAHDLSHDLSHELGPPRSPQARKASLLRRRGRSVPGWLSPCQARLATVSKVEAQRALRDARYAAYYAKQAAAANDPPTSSLPARAKSRAAQDAPDPGAADLQSAVTTEATDGPQLTTVEASGELELCGHRNIGNKTCRRPAGHSEKNHRYT